MRNVFLALVLSGMASAAPAQALFPTPGANDQVEPTMFLPSPALLNDGADTQPDDWASLALQKPRFLGIFPETQRRPVIVAVIGSGVIRPERSRIRQSGSSLENEDEPGVDHNGNHKPGDWLGWDFEQHDNTPVPFESETCPLVHGEHLVSAHAVGTHTAGLIAGEDGSTPAGWDARGWGGPSTVLPIKIYHAYGGSCRLSAM